MEKSFIPYSDILRKSIENSIKNSLECIVDKKSIRPHCIFLNFNTQDKSVQISPALFALYPKEMTIILQDGFWDLVVTDDRFEVTLDFTGKANLGEERIGVGWSAVRLYSDTHSGFVLEMPNFFEKKEKESSALAQKKDSPYVISIKDYLKK